MCAQVHMRAINGSLAEAKVGSKHYGVFLEFAADLLEECLQYTTHHGTMNVPRPDDEDARVLEIEISRPGGGIVVTGMCKAAVVAHLKTEGVDLGKFNKALSFLGVTPDTLLSVPDLASVGAAALQIDQTCDLCFD